MKVKKWVGFDIETWGEAEEYALQPWRVYEEKAWVQSFAFTNPKARAVHVFKKPTAEQLRKFLDSMSKLGVTITGANVIFDVAWLIALGLEKEVRQCKWADFSLLWKRYDAFRHTYGLKEGVKEYIPKLAGYEADVSYDPQTDEEWKKLLVYNKLDVVATRSLTIKFWKELDVTERRAALIEFKSIPDVAKSWLQGITMDKSYLIKLQSQLEKEQFEALYNLNDRLVADGFDEVEDNVLSSPKKLRKILYQDWKLHPPKYTPKGEYSTDKETLIKLAVNDERALLIQQYRKAKNRLAKFVTSPLASIEYNDDFITHPQPRMSGTYTGRMTYSSKQGTGKKERPTGIALHQWERGALVRKSIVAPEGFVIVELDFSGQEMRLMADRVYQMTGDSTMLDLFIEGKDLHGFMGANIEGLEYDWLVANKDIDKAAKQARYLGKFANLSLQYRVGIETMKSRALTQYDLWLSDADAERIKYTYLNTYVGVPHYWRQAVYLARANRYAETMGGRRVVLNDLEDYKQQQTAINTPIQGTGADMKQLALALLSPMFVKMGGSFAWDLHDALFMYMPDTSDLLDNCQELRHKMSNLPYKKAWGWEPALPLPADGSYGYRWGEMKSL